jgi:hypothetical protein
LDRAGEGEPSPQSIDPIGQDDIELPASNPVALTNVLEIT